MRVLILSCNTGEGHNSAAKAIAEILTSRGIEYEKKDALACFSKRISTLVCKGHVTIYKKIPKVFGAGYKIIENHAPRPGKHSAMYKLISTGGKKMRELVAAGDYTSVISVHPFASIMLTKAMENDPLDVFTYFVATDYTCSPGVAECRATRMFIPHRDLIPEFVEMGVREDILVPSGIPVRQALYGKRDASSAREQLDLPKDKKIILLACGSMGCGPIQNLAEKLLHVCSDDTMIVSVCGTNKKLYRKMTAFAGENDRIRVVGFTDLMHLYMDAADVAVTKPGGLSSTEAAVKGLPLIFVDAVSGCETYNLNFFVKNGFAESVDTVEGITELVRRYAEDKELRDKMSERLRANFSGNAAEIICDRMERDAADSLNEVM
jgi:processive 1,2-diacylglycerol beta-glucosyltransferase